MEILATDALEPLSRPKPKALAESCHDEAGDVFRIELRRAGEASGVAC